MSPALALDSWAFWCYTSLGLGLLVVGGIVLLLARRRWGSQLDHAWAAYRGWLLIVPVLLLVYFLGEVACLLTLGIIALLAYEEFARASGLSMYRELAIVGDCAIIGTIFLFFQPISLAWKYDVFMMMPLIVMLVVAAMPVVLQRTAGQLQAVSLATLGYLYFGWTLCHLGFLTTSSRGYGYLGWLITAVAVNDVAAYCCGKLFGRYRLCPAVSPNKTWEGFLGGLLVSFVVPGLLWFTVPYFTPLDCLALGLIVGLGGTIGDLVISVFKRDRGLKDLGYVIPGHGGMVDRLDSLLFVAPLVVQYVRLRHGF
jgi:phosphatidate cytidylyltransferase